MMSYNNNNKLEKYQKHKNKTDNTHDYINNSSHNKKKAKALTLMKAVTKLVITIII